MKKNNENKILEIELKMNEMEGAKLEMTNIRKNLLVLLAQSILTTFLTKVCTSYHNYKSL